MEIFILSLLILLNGLFVITEIALISARKSRIESLATKGDEQAKAALKLINHPEEFLSTVQIGITLISIITGVYTGDAFSESLVPHLEKIQILKPYAHPLATSLIIIIVTFLSIIFGELIPKKLGLMRAERISRIAAIPMVWLTRAMHPFVWLLSKSTTLIVRILGIRKSADSAVTEEEIKAMITEGSESGSIDEGEKEIIERVFHLGDRNITSLMTHRTDIQWLDQKDTVTSVKEKWDHINYSTYPVCDGMVDEIKGLVYIKDLLKADSDATMESLMRPAYFVPENNKTYQLLEKMRSSEIHTCFIVNEYGTLEGMITLNDILEAIVGDVSHAGQQDYEIVQREDGTYLVDGLIQFYDFLSYFERADWVSEMEGEFDTLAGFVLSELKHIPITGETFSWRDFEFEVIDLDGQRIDKVLVKISENLQESLED
jgi:putative hemolysin